jgi:hypothetical protein
MVADHQGAPAQGRVNRGNKNKVAAHMLATEPQVEQPLWVDTVEKASDEIVAAPDLSF